MSKEKKTNVMRILDKAKIPYTARSYEYKESNLEMIHVKDLPALTGYVRGGCSPIGMKKQFSTYIDSSCLFHEQISISAGQRGQQILLSARALIDFIHATTADITRTASSHL